MDSEEMEESPPTFLRPVPMRQTGLSRFGSIYSTRTVRSFRSYSDDSDDSDSDSEAGEQANSSGITITFSEASPPSTPTSLDSTQSRDMVDSSVPLSRPLGRMRSGAKRSLSKLDDVLRAVESYGEEVSKLPSSYHSLLRSRPAAIETNQLQSIQEAPQSKTPSSKINQDLPLVVESAKTPSPSSTLQILSPSTEMMVFPLASSAETVAFDEVEKNLPPMPLYDDNLFAVSRPYSPQTVSEPSDCSSHFGDGDLAFERPVVVFDKRNIQIATSPLPKNSRVAVEEDRSTPKKRIFNLFQRKTAKKTTDSNVLNLMDERKDSRNRSFDVASLFTKTCAKSPDFTTKAPQMPNARPSNPWTRLFRRLRKEKI
ncbi:hypothetical protein HDU97_009575 [Phlyctochytrium planicorne]|nr:hypothetical protein HDU97_009575 [Phlyctochytrium planicorne]